MDIIKLPDDNVWNGAWRVNFLGPIHNWSRAIDILREAYPKIACLSDSYRASRLCNGSVHLPLKAVKSEWLYFQELVSYDESRAPQRECNYSIILSTDEQMVYLNLFKDQLTRR